MGSTPVTPIVPELLSSYKNYEQWSLRVQTYLMAENLWDFVEPSTGEASPQPKPEDGEEYKVWKRNNAKGLYIILNSCGSDMLSFITTTLTAKDAWKALEINCKAKQKAQKDGEEFEPYIPFADYVIIGEWEKAEECLKQLPDAVYMRDPRCGNGDTALHLAVREGRLQTVRWLMSVMAREDIQSKNKNGYTALHTAILQGHLEIVKVLVPVMGQVKGPWGDTALHLAVRRKHVHIVKGLMLLMTQEDLRLKNNKGATAIHLAVLFKCLDIVKELFPVMGHIRDCYGDTVLHLAVHKWNARIVKELVKLMKREDLEIRNNNGYTALDLSIKNKDVPILKELVYNDDHFGRYITFTDFVSKGDWENAKECLGGLESYVHDAIRARDPRDECGNTTLHVAAKQGHAYIVKELVLLTRQKSSEENKYDGVCEETIIQKAKYLIEEKESVFEQRNVLGKTALHLAVSKGHVRVVEELIKFMTKEGLEVKDEAGYTALHRAVANGNVEIVEQLVSCMRQEGLSVRDAKGSHALLCAVKAEKMNKNIVKKLVSTMSPETLEIKDYEGYTALGRALDNPHWPEEDVKEFMELMKEMNVNVFAIKVPNRPDNGVLPVTWACIHSKEEWGRYLYSLTPLEALNELNGKHFISTCILLKTNLDIVLHLLQQYPRLAVQDHGIVDDFCPILVLARMKYAFLSGTRLTLWQKWIYNAINVQPVEFNIRDIHLNISDTEGKKDDVTKHSYFQLQSARLFKSRAKKFLRKHLGIDHVYKMKYVHLQIGQILDCISKLIYTDELSEAEIKWMTNSVFKAIDKGHHEFVRHMVPVDMEFYNEECQNIFQFATEHRQENIYNLIYELNRKQRTRIGDILSKGSTTILHAAGKLSIGARTRLDQIQGASLQMQRELQWFKEVESIVPAVVHEIMNETGLTGRELFTKNHKDLMEEAEKSIKNTASSCTVVGSLIATMMFAAAFTVPGGNNGDTGIPMFVDDDKFIAFIVLDTLSLVASTTSVIIFLGLLTSRFAENDYLTSLPKKMMLGLFTLFISIATMMIAFSYALVIMLHGKYSWIVTPAMILASVPIASFVWVQFPLLVRIFISTYGPGIFEKGPPPWYKTLMKAVVSRLGFSIRASPNSRCMKLVDQVKKTNL